ncbi:MAG: hypothetical protein LH610_03930 [Sphingomonas bacterium]|nr:hypothetical protein [Sphingomonas bacterium]
MAKKTTTKSVDKMVQAPKGFALEEALRSHFSSQRVFALRSLPFRLEGDDVTDIDLWLYESPGSTSRRRSIVDIKYKKSPQAAERLIWTKGLQTALGLETALVATTDRRPATNRLARTLKVGLIDFMPFQKMVEGLSADQATIGQTGFEALVREADVSRRVNDWKDHVFGLKSALLTNLGFGSANRALIAIGTLYEDAIITPSNSERALIAARLIYFSAACAAVSMDYALSEFAFRSRDERTRIVENGLRFGGEVNTALARVRAAASLIEKYVPDGRSMAKRVELGFLSEAEALPAQIIAEYVTRGSPNEVLFDPALKLLEGAFAREVPAFDELPTNAKALISVFIDFVGGSREKFARLWIARTHQSPSPASGELPLGNPTPS